MELPIIIFSLNDFNNINDLKGFLYEFYCFDYLLKRYRSVKIVESKFNECENIGNNYFSYGETGNVIYKIGNHVYCEFDALGIKDKKIYLWEITRSKANIISNNINRKKCLLQNIFRKFEVVAYFIIKKEIPVYKKFNHLIIPQPNYNNEYFVKGKYEFSENIKNCITLNEFVKYANGNSLINEILFLSERYFNRKILKGYMNYKEIISNLYDIDNILEDNFYYYDIERKEKDIVKYNNGKYYIKGNKVNSIEFNIIEELRHTRKRQLHLTND
jgi:hypothetical protein